MITEDKITEIFCLADDFCKYFSSELKKHQLADGKKHRNKPSKLSEAEVITIFFLFHSKGFRCLKHFYTQYVSEYIRQVSLNPHIVPRLSETEMAIACKLSGMSNNFNQLLRLCHQRGLDAMSRDVKYYLEKFRELFSKFNND